MTGDVDIGGGSETSSSQVAELEDDDDEDDDHSALGLQVPSSSTVTPPNLKGGAAIAHGRAQNQAHAQVDGGRTGTGTTPSPGPSGTNHRTRILAVASESGGSRSAKRPRKKPKTTQEALLALLVSAGEGDLLLFYTGPCFCEFFLTLKCKKVLNVLVGCYVFFMCVMMCFTCHDQQRPS